MGNRLVAFARRIEQVRGRLVIAVVLLVGLYFVVAFGEQAWKARQLQTEVAERQAVIDRMELRQAELQRQLDEFGTDRYLAYVEQTARRDLNLSHPGETVLLVRWKSAPAVETLAPTPATSSPDRDEPNWRKWLDLFTND